MMTDLLLSRILCNDQDHMWDGPLDFETRRLDVISRLLANRNPAQVSVLDQHDVLTSTIRRLLGLRAAELN